MKQNFLSGKKLELGNETIYEINLKDSPIGVALAKIKSSKEHFHRTTKEWYYVIEGNGELYLNGKKIPLRKDDFLFISPKSKHFAKRRGRKDLKVLAITMPQWNKEDHHLV